MIRKIFYFILLSMFLLFNVYSAPRPTRYDRLQDTKIERVETKSIKRDDILQTNINKEVQERKDGDIALNNKILTNSSEISRVENESITRDDLLQNSITQETADRTNTDTVLSNRISDNATEISNVDITQTKWNKKQDKSIALNSKNIATNSKRIDNLESRVDKLEETQYIVGLQGRVYDSKRLQVNLFADYSTNRNEVDRTGVRFTIKFGKSYEEKKIEKLEKKLEQLTK